MSGSEIERLSNALPSACELIREALVPEIWLSTYRDDFVVLFVEAYEAYLGGCPRASIIVAGESLLRAVFARIESEVIQRGSPLEVRVRGGKKTVGADFDTRELPEYMTFCEALDWLKKNRIFPEPALEVAYTVKDLRNHAAHGQFPLLDQWDPDSPRPLSEQRLLVESAINNEPFTFPEAYRFVPSKKRGIWFTFDCRKHYCGSLKELGIEERYAAIQYCLVVDALLRMFKATIRAGDRVRRKGEAKEGTVVETNEFSLVYRTVKWDDDEVLGLVRISDIEKVSR